VRGLLLGDNLPVVREESRFGPNEWLVDEIYEQYLQDKNAVDRAWWDFFEDYSPAEYSPAAASHVAAPAATQDAPTPQPTPAAPASPAPKTAPAAPAPTASTTDSDAVQPEILRGAPARVVANMDASLSVPTATSVRSVPVKLLMDNRVVINNHLARGRGGKVSFTHIIGYALVRAASEIRR
jgi:2-oxoglutarate decarboxylase